MVVITISAKDLGDFAIKDKCERCLWLGLHAKKFPYQIFPGIFSSIDSHTKKVIQGFFSARHVLPSWLSGLGPVVDFVEPPSYHTFAVEDSATQVRLRGSPDGIFKLRDGSHTIVDYKTAKYTSSQGALYQVYETQLNAYAYIGERLELRPVSGLALIYFEPGTPKERGELLTLVSDAGMSLGFKPTIVPVALKAEQLVPALLRRVRQVYDIPSCPPPSPGCGDCAALDGLVKLIQ